MRRRLMVSVLTGTLALAACDGGPFVPKWNIDIFFPIQFPDVVLQDFAPGNLLPPISIPFTQPVDTTEIDDSTSEILEQDIEAIDAEIIFATPTDVLGTIEVSVARSVTDLFSATSSRALTVSFPILQTLGDTTRVTVPSGLFAGATTLFLQSRGDIRSGSGTILALDPDDVLSLRINLIATVGLVR